MKENMLLVHTLFEGSGEGWSDLIAYQSLGKEKSINFPQKYVWITYNSLTGSNWYTPTNN